MFSFATLQFADQLAASVHSQRMSLLQFTPPKQLFHFTKRDAVIGIGESGVMRATSAHHLADPSEINHGVDMYWDELARMKPRRSRFAIQVLAGVPHFLEEFKKRTFLVCFCASSNSEFHWKEYGHYCLGFDTQGSADDFLVPNATNVYSRFHRVIYSDIEKATAIRRVIDSSFDCLSKTTSGICTGPMAAWHISFAARIIALELLDLIVAFKQTSYGPEKEWRLVVRPHKQTLASDPMTREAQLDFLIRGDAARRYVELHRKPLFINHPFDFPKPFDSITRSPAITNEQDRLAINHMLTRNGYEHSQLI